MAANVASGREHSAAARAALRLATHDIHERMHHHPLLARLAAGTIERDDYRRLLARSYGFYVVADPLVGLLGKPTERLALDLADLGMEAVELDRLPRCTALKIGCEDADLIGARYVLLGASLGGQVMARALAGGASRDGNLPARFLAGLDPNDWKAFAAGLGASLPDARSRTRAARAAAHLFGAYENWMTAA